MERGRYFIKDLGNGYGVFLRLARPWLLRDNQLFSMGESFLIVNFINCEAGGGSHPHSAIRIKIFAGPSNGKVLYRDRADNGW